jgi:hypothetical protein
MTRQAVARTLAAAERATGPRAAAERVAGRRAVAAEEEDRAPAVWSSVAAGRGLESSS